MSLIIDQLMCENRKCIPVAKACDGVDDCGDASDETEYCRRMVMKSPSRYECGNTPIAPKVDNSRLSRILGGEAVREGSWPWQASLQLSIVEPNGHFCGGALVAPQYVLSAAHCLSQYRDLPLLKVILGNHYAFKEESYEQSRSVSEYIVYPNKNSEYWSENPQETFDFEHDMVLLKLSAPVTFTNHVQPACLPDGLDARIGETCYVTGWGETRGTGFSHLLKQLPLRVRNDCKVDLGIPMNNRTQVCTRSEEHGSSPCAGDSGGPLSCRRDGKWYVNGVASFVTDTNGLKPMCGHWEDGTVYNRVSEKVDWIKRAMRYMDTL